MTKDTFSKSQYVQYAYDNETLIGCARAISDGAHALILNGLLILIIRDFI